MSTLKVNRIQDLNGVDIISDASLGKSSGNAAGSANSIIQSNPAAKDGLYWISMGGTPRETFCMFETNGIGWMLAARIQYGDSATWNYSNSNWTSTGVINSNSLATTEVNIKTYAFTDWGLSSIRLTGSRVNINYADNPLTFPNGGGFGGATLRTIFSSGNNSYNSEINLGRIPWMDWVGRCTEANQYSFGNQPNCNEDRINANYTYAGARLGISMNNEGDCNTNDSCIGVGLFRNGITDLGAGGISWPQSDRYPCYAWIWVN